MVCDNHFHFYRPARLCCLLLYIYFPVTEGDRRSSNIRFVSKLIQLSTTSIGFILQILNY